MMQENTVGKSEAGEALPAAPETLSFGEVRLSFARVFPGDAARGLVRYYHFRILNAAGQDVGHINFRVGDTEHVLVSAGHIGYEVEKAFRGRGFAFQACRAIAPFVRLIYESVTITCDPDNRASIRTIERLAARFVDQVCIPPHDPHYKRGSRIKNRYRWMP